MLAVLLFATLTACSGGSEESKDKTGSEGSGSVTKYEESQYAKIMMSGTYYLDCGVYVAGVKTPMKMAVDGKNSCVQVTGTGYPFRIITLDGKVYMVNDENKTYAVSEDAASPDVTGEGIVDYSKMKYETKGTAAVSELMGIDDNTYGYEEYGIAGEDQAIKIRFYLKEDNLYAIEVTYGETGSAMVINELTEQIPAGFMEVPGSYKKTDASTFFYNN
jgi:hypothetical protein